MKAFTIALLLFMQAGCSTLSILSLDEDTGRRMAALAESGNAEAQYHLGMFHNNGQAGMTRDPRRALEWFRKAAAAGDVLAAYKVGCYYAGQFPGTVEFDEEKALANKLVAARAGYSLAQHDVAATYFNRKDFAQAERWFTLAAAQGNRSAHHALYLLHARGLSSAGPQAPQQAYARMKLSGRNADGTIAPATQQSLGYLAEKLSPQEIEAAEKFVADFQARPTQLTADAMGARRRVLALVQGREQGRVAIAH